MHYTLSKTLTLIFIILAVVGSFGLGFFIGQQEAEVLPIEGVVNLEIGKPAAVDFSLFWDAWRKIQERYVSGDSLDFEAMVQGAISGMVNSLGDPYTVFMNTAAPCECQSLLGQRGSACSTGVWVQKRLML